MDAPSPLAFYARSGEAIYSANRTKSGDRTLRRKKADKLRKAIARNEESS